MQCTIQHRYLVIVFLRKQLRPLTERPLDPNRVGDPNLGFYPAYEVYTILKSLANMHLVDSLETGTYKSISVLLKPSPGRYFTT